ncbi:unnamed protein product [Aspergillus oryzae]|nr:unnamed protein product [Aspergillus oryzae]GMF88924.1 unnamed protein product [Aspergillus oryzae]
MASEGDWTCDANDAVQITLVQPGEQKPKTLSSFHPQFTYPIFGDDETIFGYKGLIIRLRFAAHDLRPHIHISYDEKFKTVGDTSAVDLIKTLSPFIPEVWLTRTDDRRYEKVKPPTPTASQYSIVGYATTYRWWFYQRDSPEKGTVTNDPFPGPEIRPAQLPARLRIAQFLILPPHQGSGHGTHLYTTIHTACFNDSTIVELTVEDPNEAFDALRDTADFHILRPEFLKHNVNINPDPYAELSKKQRPRRVPTSALIPTKLLHDIRSTYKIASTQFAHVLEMFLLGEIPTKNRHAGGANMSRLLVKKYNATDPNERRYYWWRMLVKQRLFKRSRDILIQLEMSDRIEKLEETVTNVEEGYEALIKVFTAREEALMAKQEESGESPETAVLEHSVASSSDSSTRDQRTKRKFTVEDEDEEEEGESEVSKRPKV